MSSQPSISHQPRKNNTNKSGYVELRGLKGRVYLSLMGTSFRLCKTDQVDLYMCIFLFLGLFDTVKCWYDSYCCCPHEFKIITTPQQPSTVSPNLSVYLSVVKLHCAKPLLRPACMSIYLLVCLSVNSITLLLCKLLFFLFFLCFCVYNCLSTIHPSIHSFIHSFIYPSVCLSVYLSVYLQTSLC